MNRNISLDVVNMDLRNSTQEWDYGCICSHINIINWKSMIKCGYNKGHISECRDISIFWIDHIDRVGICKNPKWITDISILCSN
jgi:hypothetical protein